MNNCSPIRRHFSVTQLRPQIRERGNRFTLERKLGLLLLAFLVFPLMSQAQGNNYENLFWEQIFSSCQSGDTWRKSVYDLKGDTPETPQVKEYKINCLTGEFTPLQENDLASPGTHEFDFLFEYDANNQYIVEYFDLIQDEKGLLATIKSDNSDDTPLQRQEFKLNSKGQLTYAKSVILKDNMLYTMKVTIEVFFDESGRYQRHLIETETDPIAQDGVHTRIEGKWVN